MSLILSCFYFFALLAPTREEAAREDQDSLHFVQMTLHDLKTRYEYLEERAHYKLREIEEKKSPYRLEITQLVSKLKQLRYEENLARGYVKMQLEKESRMVEEKILPLRLSLLSLDEEKRSFEALMEVRFSEKRGEIAFYEEKLKKSLLPEIRKRGPTAKELTEQKRQRLHNLKKRK